MAGKKINGVFLQKAIIFAKINKEQKKSVGILSNKIAKLNSVINGEDKIVAEMNANGFKAIEVQYNPESIQIMAGANVSDEEDAAGTDGDSGGQVELNSQNVLSFKLIFEAVDLLPELLSGKAEEKKDELLRKAGLEQVKNTVKKDAEGMIALMVSDITRNVTFYYGGVLFSGELTDVDVQYKMFDNKGNPLWAEVTISIQENEEEPDETEEEGNDDKKPSADFAKLENEYGGFKKPVAVIKVNDKDISESKSKLTISDLEVELSSGYEASIATFSIYNSFDKTKSEFKTDELKKYIMLGSVVSISTGYGEIAKNIFRGFIARVNFIYSKGEMPHIEITCMDAKAIMMAGNHAKQLEASNYGDAVNEIFQEARYAKLQNQEIITELLIGKTPDKKTVTVKEETTDKSIEMVNESDYEFVVRAAKKFNYEFFIDSGKVIFRKAKEVTGKLMDLKLGNGINKFDVEYDMTGLVENIQVRGMDSKKVKLIKAKRKWNSKVSMGNKAKQLIKKSERIYIDPTVTNQQEADYRTEYLLEDMSYRFATMTCTCKGMPELKPGNIIGVQGLGNPVDNEFYITSVKHIFTSDNEYISDVTAKAAKIK